MVNLIKVFFTGLFISFLGSLPLGSLNIAAMQVAVEENVKNAIKFSCGVCLAELLYVRLCLKGMDWVVAHQQLFNLLEWATVILFIVLAISSFLTARKNIGERKNVLLSNRMNRFWMGFTISALNPVQIPFWFIWSTYLLSNNILSPTDLEFNIYTAGIGIGTLAGLAVFIFGGQWVVRKVNASHRIINFTIGMVFLISAAIQLYRVVYKPLNEQLKENIGLDMKK